MSEPCQPGPFRLKPGVLEPDNSKDPALPYTDQQNLLLKVMRVGFQRMAVSDPGAWGVPDAIDAVALFGLKILQNPRGGARELRLVFRGR
ncbi:MAG: hypothetical protein HXY18_08335 [Bryobacteraceae bacterium]|nr:hypothetical protein [Bryobacteraceae bacterium]